MENKLRDNKGKFKKGNDGFWFGKKRSEEDKKKMSKPKKTKYIELGIKDFCKFCKKEFIKSIHNQLYCKECVPTSLDLKLVKKYKISHKQYLEMIQLCSGKCQICLKQKATDIDHDHKTGKVRGLLCHNCNMLLGHSKDNIDILNGSVEYLIKSKNYGK